LFLLFAGTFKIKTEYPSSAGAPSNKEYVAVMAASPAGLPGGTRFLKLVIVDPGCGVAHHGRSSHSEFQTPLSIYH
jgi:hypothetical protein